MKDYIEHYVDAYEKAAAVLLETTFFRNFGGGEAEAQLAPALYVSELTYTVSGSRKSTENGIFTKTRPFIYLFVWPYKLHL